MANIITGIRIVLSVALLFCQALSPTFYALYIAAGFSDMIDGYPEPDIGYIGFFMMNAALQGKQLGSTIIQDVCAYLKQIGKTAIRLGIAKDNPQANHFWKKNGFTVIKEVEREGWIVLVAEKRLW